MDMFDAFHRDVTISAAGGESVRAASRAASEVAERCDRLSLVCEALWELLRDRMGVAEIELIDKINEIDLRDGKLDGRTAKAGVRECHKCNRPNASRHSACIYCSEPLARSPFD